MVFLPFHYGYWDATRRPDGATSRAANELTITDWDPVSKQPLFKTAAARVTRLRSGTGPAPAPTTAASAPVAPVSRPPSAAPGRGRRIRFRR